MPSDAPESILRPVWYFKVDLYQEYTKKPNMGILVRYRGISVKGICTNKESDWHSRELKSPFYKQTDALA